MRFVANKWKFPQSFARHPNAKSLIAEADITIHRRGRLAAKLLIFDTPKSLRRFWRFAMGNDVGSECRGVVNMLGREVHTFSGNRGRVRMTGDAKYFCVIGLCKSHLCMEIIAHEAVHAGFAYERRVKRNLFGEAGKFNDEERIAYPAGMIAAAINRFIHKKNLYPS